MGIPYSFAGLLADKLDSQGLPLWQQPSASCRTRPFEPSTFAQFACFEESVRLAYRQTAARRAGRSARSLTAHQRDALGVLRGLGARLQDDFDAAELRSSFRQLALSLHPDRHPGASAETRSQLGGRFARLCEAYRTLQAATGLKG